MIATRRTSVSTTISMNEKKILEEIAQEWGLKPGTILRRLVLHLLQGKITLLEILKKPSVQEIDSINSSDEERNFFPIRSALSQTKKEALLTISKEWDFTVSAILRRLIRALTSGDIPKNSLW